MKIALDFSKKAKYDYLKEFKKRNFKVDMNSCGTMWVYDLRTIYTTISTSNKMHLVFETNNFDTYSIDLEDIRYFEIHSE